MPFDPHLKDQSDENGLPKPKLALLVSTYQGAGNLTSCHEHLDELELLCETLGVAVAEKVPCQLRTHDASTFLTKGKLEEILQRSKETNVDVLIIDDEISPGQQRNLEEIFKIEVIDRTEVILGVFAHRAKSKEAKLQVELARVRYEAPRLKRLWTHLSRQKATTGGGAYLKGEGEKQIEIDRRILKKKIADLQKEIEEVKAHRDTRRSFRLRNEIPTFALVGYTNAGKSTLLNALTDADVFVEDKLFATLDTTTRKFTLPNHQEVLLTDTVGFIRKLPHLLVASFKSTLEEALQADFLLHIVDVSHHNVLEQAETTFQVLKQLGAGEKPMITVLNKMDLSRDSAVIQKLKMLCKRSVQVSALRKTGFHELQEIMINELAKSRKIINIRIPQSEYALVSEIMRSGIVLKQEYDENDILMSVDVPSSLLFKLKSFEVVDG